MSTKDKNKHKGEHKVRSDSFCLMRTVKALLKVSLVAGFCWHSAKTGWTLTQNLDHMSGLRMPHTQKIREKNITGYIMKLWGQSRVAS